MSNSSSSPSGARGAGRRRPGGRAPSRGVARARSRAAAARKRLVDARGAPRRAGPGPPGRVRVPRLVEPQQERVGPAPRSRRREAGDVETSRARADRRARRGRRPRPQPFESVLEPDGGGRELREFGEERLERGAGGGVEVVGDAGRIGRRKLRQRGRGPGAGRSSRPAGRARERGRRSFAPGGPPRAVGFARRSAPPARPRRADRRGATAAPGRRARE